MTEYDLPEDGTGPDTSGYDGPVVTDGLLPETSAAAGMGTITPTSVFCVQCGYNLTGVAIGATCPECGRLVAPSFHGQIQPTSGKAVASLVLGICSIPACMLYGIPAIVCGILAIVFTRKARAQIQAGEAGPSSRGMATAGLICGIVGLCLGLLYIGIIVVFIVFSTSTYP